VNSETIGTLIGLGVFILLRVVDYLLPKGRHLRWIDRFTTLNDQPEDEEG
jgi:hypothetical protein